jgi:tRNA threonylcarbamoyladenosine biosynthesis protein TsaE
VIVARTDAAVETRALAAATAGVLQCGDIVLLCGELGAGKTTFAQGVAMGLGVADVVTSPTFTLLRPYPCASSATGVRTLWHADLYRLDRGRDVMDLGIGELVDDDAVALVEWGDMARPVFGVDTWEVRLSRPPGGDDERRDVTIAVPDAVTGDGDRHHGLVHALSPWTADVTQGT